MKKILLVLCFTCMFIQFSLAESPANAHLLKEGVVKELKLERASLAEAVEQLRELTKTEEEEVNFLITPEAAALNKVVTLDLRGISGVDALAIILRQTGTRAEIKNDVIWILPNS